MRFSIDEVAMKDAYIDALMELAGESSNCGVGCGLDELELHYQVPKAFPRTGHQRRCARSQYAGDGCGLAAVGKIPFTHTFAALNAALDQIYMSVALQLPVKIVGTDPGVTAAFNGGTHMPLEVLAFAGIPTMT